MTAPSENRRPIDAMLEMARVSRMPSPFWRHSGTEASVSSQPRVSYRSPCRVTATTGSYRRCTTHACGHRSPLMGRFVADSLLEGAGSEPSVPLTLTKVSEPAHVASAGFRANRSAARMRGDTALAPPAGPMVRILFPPAVSRQRTHAASGGRSATPWEWPGVQMHVGVVK